MKINNSLDVAQWEKLDKNSDEYKKCKILKLQIILLSITKKQKNIN